MSRSNVLNQTSDASFLPGKLRGFEPDGGRRTRADTRMAITALDRLAAPGRTATDGDRPFSTQVV